MRVLQLFRRARCRETGRSERMREDLAGQGEGGAVEIGSLIVQSRVANRVRLFNSFRIDVRESSVSRRLQMTIQSSAMLQIECTNWLQCGTAKEEIKI
jgi:hypothetical protein